MPNSLLKNSLFLSMSRFFSRGLGLISTFIVARLLSPEDYAVIAIAMIVQDFALRMQNLGFIQNIVTTKKIDSDFLSAIFFSRFLIFLFISLILFFSAHTFGDWLDSHEAGRVLNVICWIIMLAGLQNLNVSVATRDNNYLPEIKVAVYSKVISIITTIVAAYVMESYWALAIGMLVAAFSQTVISYLVAPSYLPSKFSVSEMRAQLNFSKWFFYQTLLAFFNAKLPIFIIAKYFSEKTLGFITMATNLVDMYAQEISASFDKANFTYLSKKLEGVSDKDKRSILSQNIDYMLTVKNTLVLPIYAFLAIFSLEVIEILLGSQWLEMADIFSVLCLGSIAYSWETTYRTVFNVLRRPQINFHVGMLRLILLTVIGALTIYYGNYWYIVWGLPISSLFVVGFSIFNLNSETDNNLLFPVLKSMILFFLLFILALSLAELGFSVFLSGPIFLILTTFLILIVERNSNSKFLTLVILNLSKKLPL